MKRRLKLLVALLAVLGASLGVVPASAIAEEQAVSERAAAVSVSLDAGGWQDASVLQDGSYETFASFLAGETLGVTAWEGSIGGLYVCWYLVPGTWTLSYMDAAGVAHEQTCGQGGFLHEYVALEGEGVTSCTLEFPNGAIACTLQALGFGNGRGHIFFLPADLVLILLLPAILLCLLELGSGEALFFAVLDAEIFLLRFVLPSAVFIERPHRQHDVRMWIVTVCVVDRHICTHPFIYELLVDKL